jgi:hypothetical protein
MNNQHDNSIRNQVLLEVESGRVSMKPRWHFILLGTLAALGGVIIALLLLYLISFIIFAVHQTGVSFVPAFGLRGWVRFLTALPWLLIVFSLVFMGILEVLVRRYSIAYSRPLLVSLGGIIVVAVAGGCIVARTTFHRQLFVRAQQHHLPMLGERFYRGFGSARFTDLQRGVIVATTSEGFEITNPWGEQVRVVITPQTRLPFDDEFAPGKMVLIFGDGTSTVRAFGIRAIGGEDF